MVTKPTGPIEMEGERPRTGRIKMRHQSERVEGLRTWKGLKNVNLKV
jgi:hypothetical protein